MEEIYDVLSGTVNQFYLVSSGGLVNYFKLYTGEFGPKLMSVG